MAPLPPAAATLKIQFQHVTSNVPAWVHWYAKYAGSAPQAADAAAIANTCKSLWTTNIAPLVTGAISLNLVQVTDLSSASGAQGQSGSGAVSGTRTGAGTTANDCMLINLHITRRYRGGKPRQYWPGGAAADLADGMHWSAGFQTSWQAAWNAMNSGINAITWTGGNMSGPVNVSYYTLPNTVVTSPTTGRARNVPTKRSTPLIDPIVSGTPNARIATQRRREHFSA